LSSDPGTHCYADYLISSLGRGVPGMQMECPTQWGGMLMTMMMMIIIIVMMMVVVVMVVCVCVCVCVSFCVHVSTMKRQNRASRSCFSSASFMLSYVVQPVVKSLP
jgi:uncharacterized membrane protein